MPSKRELQRDVQKFKALVRRPFTRKEPRLVAPIAWEIKVNLSLVARLSKSGSVRQMQVPTAEAWSRPFSLIIETFPTTVCSFVVHVAVDTPR
jgi:hypothetical protein